MILRGFVLSADFHKVHYDQYVNGHRRALIIAHGFYNSKQAFLLRQLAQTLAGDYDVILFDFRGHGRSEEIFFWTSKEYLDLLAVVELARGRYEKIGLVGFSLGAATGIIAASKTSDIDSVVCVSAPTEVGRIDYHFWNLSFKNDIAYNWFGQGRQGKGVRLGPFWHKKERPIDLVGVLKTPVFYIHGDADWIVRSWHSQKLYEHTRAFKRISIIEKGPHAEFLFKENGPQMLGLVREWFHETLH